MIFLDHLGGKVHLPEVPKRIVSLVPSQTELLFDLGLDAEIVGITKFCVFPEDLVRSKTKVGGTKNVHLERVHELQPDLIIANQEENTKEVVEALKKHFPVFVSRVSTVNESLKLIVDLGAILNRKEEALDIRNKIKGKLDNAKKLEGLRAMYLIWKNPWMSVGGDTFVSSMMSSAGMVNVLADRKRYPSLTLEEMAALKPDLLLLSTEPYPFAEKDLKELEAVFPGWRIKIIAGELFSWYGSRMLNIPDDWSTIVDV